LIFPVGLLHQFENLPKTTAHIFISYLGIDRLKSAVVTITAPAWVENYTSQIKTASIQGPTKAPLTLQCSMGARAMIPPSDMKVKIVATFTTTTTKPHCASAGFRMPMHMACELTKLADEETPYKVTIQTNRELVRGIFKVLRGFKSLI